MKLSLENGLAPTMPFNRMFGTLRLLCAIVMAMCILIMGECRSDTIARQFEDTGAVWALAVSPDGKVIASGGANEIVQLRDIVTGEVQATLPRQEPFIDGPLKNYVLSMAYSSDGAFLAVGYNDGSIALWNLASDEVSRAGRIHEGSVHSLAFSRDGRWMASGANSSGEDIVQLWNMQTRELEWKVPGLQYRADSIAFSPDSKLFACANADGKVTLVKIETKETSTLSEAVPGGANFARSLSFSPDGKTLAGVTYDNEIRLWDVQTSKLKQEFTGSGRANDGITSVAFSPDGKLLAVSTGSNIAGPVELRDAETGEIRSTLATEVKGGVLAFTPDGKSLVIGSRNQNLAVWYLP